MTKLSHVPGSPNKNQPGDPSNSPAPPEPCAEVQLDPCHPIVEWPLPATRVTYIAHVEAAAPRWRPAPGAHVELACNEVEGSELIAMAEIELAQDWYLQQLVRGDVASVISLGPGERQTMRVTRSQRTKFDSNTMRSKESVRSQESQTADKEVLDVARTVTRNERWQVSASGRVQAGPVAVSVSAGYQQSVQNQTSNRLQQVRDATQTASGQLRTLNKIEVSESTELSFTDEQVRTVQNPYRDRSLNLTVFELNKVYCVKYSVAAIRPVLAFRAPRIRLDRDFVLRNGDFLANELVDRRLADELRTSLEYAASSDEVVGVQERLDRLAHMALDHLFGPDDVHFIILGGGSDNAEFSFLPDADTNPRSAWQEAKGREFVNELWLLLGSFRKIAWVGDMMLPISPSTDAVYARLELIDAMAAEIKLLWTQVDNGDKAAIFDQSHATMVFRRVPAFLAIVENLIQPLLESAAQPGSSDQRAETVLRRVVAHLACMQAFYSERYHQYVYQLANRTSHHAMVRKAILNDLGLSLADKRGLLEEFDMERAYLESSVVFVPYRGVDGRERLKEWFPDEDFDVEVDAVREEVVLPADGQRIEPSVGSCTLASVPEVSP